MSESHHPSPRILAVCGKGGVGKTAISASLVKILNVERGKKVLAIDADPAVGLATALGMTPKKTVDDVRNQLIETVKSGKSGTKQEVNALLDYELLDALEERHHLAFLAIGRPEKEGCYCQVNSMLKDIIRSLAQHFDYVVIDGEAGIEQVNRRVMETVTHLVLVSDASAKGLKVTETINDVSQSAIHYEKSGLILNRIRGKAERDQLRMPESLNFIGWLPEDETVRRFDIQGKSFLELTDSPALEALRSCMRGWV